MCFETRDRIFASVCKERDDLKKRLAAATEVWDGIKEDMEAEILRLTNIAEHQANMNRLATELALELDTVTADRNRLKEAYNAMSRDLEKMSARLTEAQNELVRVKAERDALVKIVGESSANCDYCKHVNTLVACPYGVTCAICKCANNCVCGKCECGSGFEYIGLEGK